MRKNSTMKNRSAKTLTRGRVAMVTGGVVAALALGSTAAFAAEGSQHDGFLAAGSTATAVQAVQDQAQGQQATVLKAKPVAAAKQDASSGWVTPTTGYKLGAQYNQAGAHWAHKHSGQDFVVPTGTKVRAAHEGTVVQAGWGGAYGNNIVIKHAAGLYTQYGHLSKLGVHVGQKVNTGQTIGLSGSTGNSTGPHLHFEVRTTPYYGSSVEPVHFLKEHGVNA